MSNLHPLFDDIVSAWVKKCNYAQTRETVAKETCKCIRCSWCGGMGRTRDGDYMGSSERCEECGGSGITQACARCEYLEELDREP